MNKAENQKTVLAGIKIGNSQIGFARKRHAGRSQRQHKHSGSGLHLSQHRFHTAHNVLLSFFRVKLLYFLHHTASGVCMRVI